LFKLSDAGAWDVFLGKVQGDYVPLEATIEARDCFDESGIPDVQQGGIKAVCRVGTSAVGVDLSVRPVEEFFDIAPLRDAWGPLNMHRAIGDVISQLNQSNNCRVSGGQWYSVREAASAPGLRTFVRDVLEKFVILQGTAQFASPCARAGEVLQTPEFFQGSSSSDDVSIQPVQSLLPLKGLATISGGCLLLESGLLQYASGFDLQRLTTPVTLKPCDVLRATAGRLVKVPKWRKQDITQDTTQTREWHLVNGEAIVRKHFADRGLADVLGKSTCHRSIEADFIVFEYRQPQSAAQLTGDRPWLADAHVSDMDAVYHAMYWECAPSVLASGAMSESTQDNSLGEREFHGVAGTYTSPSGVATLLGVRMAL
jgi:hypothetical protein